MKFTQDNISLIQILGVVLPIISVFISYKLGLISNEKKYDREILEKRYFNFYVPFIKLLYINFAWDIKPHDYNTEEKKEFIDLINEHLHYLDNLSLRTYPTLYYSYGNLLCNNTSENQLEFSKSFREFALLVLEESISISDELKLPTLAMPFLEILKNNYN